MLAEKIPLQQMPAFSGSDVAFVFHFKFFSDVFEAGVIILY